MIKATLQWTASGEVTVLLRSKEAERIGQEVFDGVCDVKDLPKHVKLIILDDLRRDSPEPEVEVFSIKENSAAKFVGKKNRK